jgi:hypothetical protein
LSAIPHGTYSGYNNYRCRCLFCCDAATEYQREYRLRHTLPLDPERERLNASLIQNRLDAWKALYEAGRAGEVCDAIVRNRPVPRSLLAVLCGSRAALQDAA